MNAKHRRVEKLEQAARQRSAVAGTFWWWWSGLTDAQRRAQSEDTDRILTERVERIARRLEEDGETMPASEEEIAQTIAEVREGIRRVIEGDTGEETWT